MGRGKRASFYVSSIATRSLMAEGSLEVITTTAAAATKLPELCARQRTTWNPGKAGRSGGFRGRVRSQADLALHFGVDCGLIGFRAGYIRSGPTTMVKCRQGRRRRERGRGRRRRRRRRQRTTIPMMIIPLIILRLNIYVYIYVWLDGGEP